MTGRRDSEPSAERLTPPVQVRAAGEEERGQEDKGRGWCCWDGDGLLEAINVTGEPLSRWFLAILMIVQSKKGVSSNQLKRMLNVSYKTAWYLTHRIRKAMESDDSMLRGIVEVDETFIGGKLAIAAPSQAVPTLNMNGLSRLLYAVRSLIGSENLPYRELVA